MELSKSIWDHAFVLAVKHRLMIIRFLQVLSLGVIGILYAGGRSVYYQDVSYGFFYRVAILGGKLAIILFVATTIPGMCRRFGIRHKGAYILMMFRRQIGVLTYMFILVHVSFLRVIPILSRQMPFPYQPMIFEISGAIASAMLFLLFITSNDVSVRKLGNWWTRIHKLIYVSMWFILLHVGLQSMSVWTVLIGVTCILELASFIVAQRKKSM